MHQNGPPVAAVDSGVGFKKEIANCVSRRTDPVECIEDSPIAASHQQSTLIKLMVRHDIGTLQYGEAYIVFLDLGERPVFPVAPGDVRFEENHA